MSEIVTTSDEPDERPEPGGVLLDGDAGHPAGDGVTRPHLDEAGSGTSSTDDGDDWDDDPLPPPRGRLLTPITWVLLGALIGAAGFAVGARVERSHAIKDATAAATAAVAARAGRFGAGAGGFGAGTGTGTGATGTGATGTGGGAGTGRTGTGAAAAAGPTVGTVKLVDAGKLYVQDAQGNLIIVIPVATATVTQASSAQLADLVAGQVVSITGSARADGTIDATAIAGSPAAAPAAGGAAAPTTVAAGNPAPPTSGG